VPALAKLLQAREQLTNLMRYMDGKVAAEDQIKKLLGNPELMSALRDRAAEAETHVEADADAPPDAEAEEGDEAGKGKGKGKK
jgi:type VI secretion system protein ImpB